MSVVTIENIGSETLDRAGKLLAGFPGGLNTAVKRAMQRAVSHLQTSTVDVIREKYDISASAVRAEGNVKVSYKYGDGVTASVYFKGNKIPLFRYGGTYPTWPMRDTGKWVAAMIKEKWAMTHPGVTVGAGEQHARAILVGFAAVAFGWMDQGQ